MDFCHLVTRQQQKENTNFRVGSSLVGDRPIVIMAGPCAVENREDLIGLALQLRQSGAHILRGGAFKPRTSPYSFCGLGVEGLKILAAAGQASGMPVVTEVMDARDLEMVAAYADILQVGSRNMQNFTLLQEVGKVNKPVLLKRGLSATIEEWLMAAEYILAAGNSRVILCERGIRTFETFTRNTLDISAIPSIKELSPLPIIADPSHASGRWELVNPLAKAAIAAGADGLLIEVHPHPEEALSDGPQSLTPVNFTRLMAELKPLASAIGRTLEQPS